MKTIKKLCTPRKSVFDPARRDTVLSLNNLVKQQIPPEAFFAENHMTQGMRVLLTEGFKRLEGRSDQDVFRLTQAMGGGKTHNLIAFGLLAQHPEYRAAVMGGFHTPAPGLGKARVITFSGRESDSPYGIWGAIAQQVGRLEYFQRYYSPLSAPGETAWANLLKGEPTVIMLDELPPYFEYARSKPIGDSNLAVVTGTALANLLVAVTEELPQCCVIITDLKASYEGGTQQLSAALRNLDQETDRVALDLEPVRLASDEFYHILRKRIFETLPSADEVAEVAQGYVKALREARQMDVTSVSPEQFGALVEASYPFHPSIRDLYARFKENQGFQQTRGLIRLMRTVVARLWQDDGADPFLIGAQDLDLNDRDTLAEVQKINPTLGPAISHDIADNGKVEQEVERQLASMLAIEDDEDLNFSDSDYQLAAYAAALRVVTQYRVINGEDVEQALSRPRRAGERPVIEAIIEEAVRTASNYLIPRRLAEAEGQRRDLWRALSPEERFYLKGLEVEGHGEYRSGVYQEFARGFGLREYRPMLHTGKANETRLATATELRRKELGTAGFGSTLLRHVLFAVHKTRETDSAEAGYRWLHDETPGGYWTRRTLILALLRYLSGLPIAHWAADSSAARILAGRIENEHT